MPAPGREAHPPPLSRRSFLRLAAVTVGATLLPAGLARAAGGLSATTAPAGVCIEDLPLILNLAATAEALAMTFYYKAIQSDFFVRLPTDIQNAFRAALDQERSHYQYLTARGAAPLQTSFYFPPRTFGFDDLAVFVATIEKLESDFMAAYLVAARRFVELGEPVLAEIAGQIVGIEAEHRIIGREVAGDSPPPPNDLCFESAPLECPAQMMGIFTFYLHGGANYQGPFAMPSDAQVIAAINGFTCEAVPLAAAAPCQDSLVDILSIAAAAEAVGITFYYQGILGSFFHDLSEARQWYLQAALDEERNHLAYLTAQGAAPPPTRLYYPANAFDDLPTFLGILDTLENAFIAAYLAAMQQFARLGEPLLAQTAGQILGIEAEHRILGRFIGGQQPPNNLCLVRASFACVADAAAALRPFLEGSDTFTRPADLPTTAQINVAVDRFGCAPVPTAAYRAFLPGVRRATR